MHDLTKPIQPPRRFELVVSLEVAEHLPVESAEDFVGSLVAFGDVVVFSAAVPGQGGTHHVNEQWPDYWVKRFDDAGYRVFDCFRSRFWTDDGIDWWYRQNLFLFVAESRFGGDPALCRILREADAPLPFRVVHPAMHEARIEATKYVQRVEDLKRDLALHVSTSEKLVLVDEDNFRGELSDWKALIPFPEKDGQYNGKPAGSSEAIQELERLREQGAEYAVVTGNAFWWLDYYEAFGAHLADKYACCFRGGNLVIFDLCRVLV